ncbi:shikimate dehydrogenase [Schaalia sp. 19OD2882]|uniref:shikimate dehydrogenase n=1 Tax=Schaalia sp. 19OD2882 TaxID=2794089 RepID=UPI001C1F0854|nr:shikimate dehydrogenase [Schaalia sp. 19OD2882]QWW20494.1 shikimate dehydrogenase [Schaalia sp. 19OD2882]
MPWAAVIGSPIDHSLSPVLHTAAWRSLGLDGWTYRRITCEQSQVGHLLSCLDQECRGLSVTMPCKQAVIPLLDAVDPLAQAVGAVNTVIPTAGVLTGFNTDVAGIQRSLEAVSVRSGAPPQRALVIGAGATASSALAALGGMGIHDLTVAARRFGGPDSVVAAATRLGLEFTPVSFMDVDGVVAAIDRADVVVSTVPAHVCDPLAARVRPRPTQVLLDVVYSPRETALLRAWKSHGGAFSHGLDMLTHQALMQVKLMTGRDADPTVMRESLDEAVGPTC